MSTQHELFTFFFTGLSSFSLFVQCSTTTADLNHFYERARAVVQSVQRESGGRFHHHYYSARYVTKEDRVAFKIHGSLMPEL